MLASKLIKSKTGRLIPVVLASFILAGCPGMVPNTSRVTPQEELTGSSAQYLQQLQQSDAAGRPALQLLASRALLREGKIAKAAEMLRTLPQQLTDVQRQEALLVQAEILSAQNNRANSLLVLNKLDVTKLSPAQKIRYYQTQINATSGAPTLDMVRTYIAQEQLVSEQSRQGNLDQTWATLTRVPAASLENPSLKSDETVLRGWLALLNTYQDNKQDPSLLKTAIKLWQDKHSAHPAAALLPTQLVKALNFEPSSSAKVALLLPMNGKAQVFSQAIQQGFSAAANASTQPAANPELVTENPQDPLSYSKDPSTMMNATSAAGTQSPNANLKPSATGAVQVLVYDTSSKPMASLMAQVEKDGATLVVGPLIKSQVEQLANIPTTLNILALNQPEKIVERSNICYFALSPEDEAGEAARRMWEQGKKKPLLLVPRGAYGDRITKAFAQHWQEVGGQNALVQTFGSTNDLRLAINKGASIKLTGKTLVGNTLNQPITIGDMTIEAPTDEMANSGIDSIYVVATQPELTLIKPLLDMNGGAERPAIYASSRSYQSNTGPGYRMEMEGIQYSDIPLLAGTNPTLQNQVSTQLGNDYMLVRLYAMGMDAWTLANNFNQMRQIGGFRLSGYTGDMTANSDCVVSRKQSWLTFQQGQVVPAQ